MASAPFRSDRSWRFDAGRDVLWDRIAATGDYSAWWPWLKEFDGTDGLVAGARWSCVVSPPLPYSVRFVVHIDRIEPGAVVESTISGDIGGTATLTLESGAVGTRARLCSALHPTNRLLRGFGVVARPLIERGHDWVLDEGRRQFVERALD